MCTVDPYKLLLRSDSYFRYCTVDPDIFNHISLVYWSWKQTLWQNAIICWSLIDMITVSVWLLAVLWADLYFAVYQSFFGFHVRVICRFTAGVGKLRPLLCIQPTDTFKRSATSSWNCTVNDPLTAFHVIAIRISEVAVQSTVVVPVCPCVCVCLFAH